MNTTAFEVAQAVLLSLGGGALIVFALSTYIGKIWAQRILQKEKSKHDKVIAKFTNKLEELSEIRSINYQQKIELYKLISNPMVELLALLSKDGLTKNHYLEFDRQRLHITAQLGLFAPLKVFQAFNDMIDYIYDSLDSESYNFPEFREKSLCFLSSIRKDIGIHKDDLKYSGTR